MVPVAWRLLLWLFPPEIDRLPITDAQFRARLDALGPLDAGERRTLAVFGAAIAAWILTPLVESWTGGRIALPAEAIGLAAV
jgi:solute carrier family 13 (sodium-dependent dicarboxylate transporter), member 2/3/5